MSAVSEDFYKNLPEAPNFTEALLPKWLHPLPDDWLVIKSDMVGSTRNILEGRYKEVNSSAGLLVIAAANALGNMNFPFFFGGDGVTLAIHHSKHSQVRPILAGVIKEIKDIFGFDYRLAIFPVCDIYKAGFELKCSVVRISEKYRQAVLVGSGVDWMETELKTLNRLICSTFALSRLFSPICAAFLVAGKISLRHAKKLSP
ncbi:MAG: hypothetical protein CMR00_08500 [[Chlorobium] sp. 445]|nr:MAG: hypothetical protein CMR00_08500 [[Chlorobium] sp. 445]